LASVFVPAGRGSAVTALPDITVLGQWTYLATEVVFGSVALALVYRAGAVRRAARTIATLYPVAYVWDWYTLEVGVFAIPMRTGVELLGIPVEEHLFIVVVPLFVLGIHETLHDVAPAPGATAGAADTPSGDDGGPEPGASDAAAGAASGPAGEGDDGRTAAGDRA
jgi:lycopene cyclase domain-containing protein